MIEHFPDDYHIDRVSLINFTFQCIVKIAHTVKCRDGWFQMLSSDQMPMMSHNAGAKDAAWKQDHNLVLFSVLFKTRSM